MAALAGTDDERNQLALPNRYLLGWHRGLAADGEIALPEVADFAAVSMLQKPRLAVAAFGVSVGKLRVDLDQSFDRTLPAQSNEQRWRWVPKMRFSSAMTLLLEAMP